MKRAYIILLTASLWGTPSLAQEAWDLRKCIDYAIEHNLSIKQQEANMEQREVELNTAKWRRLPNLNANIGQSFNFGRGLQADNTYADTNTKSSNFSVSTNIPLFTGLEIPNTIALSKLNLKAAMEDLNKAKEDISMQVTSYYLQVLFNEELAKVAHDQVKLSQEQLERKVAYFKTGKASEAELYEAKARVAQDELSATQADNNVELALLDLSQLLELTSPEGFHIVSPEVGNILPPLSLPEEIYQEAVMIKPSIKAAQLRLEGAERSIRIAQSGLMPQLSFSAGMGTNYYNLSGIENPSFSSQWHRNLSKYLSFNLSIPIFNRFQTRNQIRKARIDRSAISWQLEESKKNLYKEIQQAYYNAVAAESKFKSSKVAMDAAEASFNLIKEKYANGMATATEYNESRTNWMRTVSDQVQAKYDYLFRSKILDFYKGKPIE